MRRSDTATVANDVREGGRWTLRQRIKNDLIWTTIRIALWWVRRVPRRVLLGLSNPLGTMVWALWSSGRSKTKRALDVASRYAAREKRKITLPNAHEVFCGLAEMLIDGVLMLRPEEPPGARLSLDPTSRDVLRNALEEGNGVVFITAHLGPWERMAALLASEDFPISTVARESYDARLNEVYEQLRQRRGVHALYRGAPGFTLKLARALRAGRIVGFPMDLPSRVASVDVPWFGVMRKTAMGPAAIALKTRAAIVVGTPQRADDGSLRVVIERLNITVPRAETSVEDLTRRFVEALQLRVLGLPNSWPWMAANIGDCPNDSGPLDSHAMRRRSHR